MATKNTEAIIESEKNTGHYEENADLEHVKPVAGGNVDYTGSVAKTDPKEIALVRKIDWRLMVSPSALSNRNYVFWCTKLTNFSLRCAQCTSL